MWRSLLSVKRILRRPKQDVFTLEYPSVELKKNFPLTKFISVFIDISSAAQPLSFRYY